MFFSSNKQVLITSKNTKKIDYATIAHRVVQAVRSINSCMTFAPLITV